MTAFRILDQTPVYLDLLGQPASGGTLRFFESGTDTPKDVFGDPNLTVNNGSSVLIGTDGRTADDVWGDGVYRVRLYASDNTLIAEAEDVEIPGGDGATFPALVANQFLTNDGAVKSWAPIIQVPDPTGNAGKSVGTDGVNVFWEAKPDIPTPAVGTGSFNFGGVLIQWGNGTAPASGTRRTSLNVSFNSPFAGTPNVSVNPTAPINSAGLIGTSAAYSASTGGFSAQIDSNIDNTGSEFNITSPVTFTWIAIGQAPA